MIMTSCEFELRLETNAYTYDPIKIAYLRDYTLNPDWRILNGNRPLDGKGL